MLSILSTCICKEKNLELYTCLLHTVLSDLVSLQSVKIGEENVSAIMLLL